MKNEKQKLSNESINQGQKTSLAVKGLHCTACAQIIEKSLKSNNTIFNAVVNPITEKVEIVHDSKVNWSEINQNLQKLGYTLVEYPGASLQQATKSITTNKQNDLAQQKTKLKIFIPITAIILINVFIGLIGAYTPLNWSVFIPSFIFLPLVFIISSLTYFWLGKDFAQAAWRFLRIGKANMDTLIGIGTGTAYFYSTFIFLFPHLASSLNLTKMYFFDVTIVVIVLVYLGKYLEGLAKLKTSSVLESLINLQAKTALIEKNGQELEVSISDLLPGDIMIVKPGEKIPTDGLIILGEAAIDESLVTGESIPSVKSVNDRVIGSTINQQGYLKIKALKVGEDTFLSNIIKAVDKAQNSKAPIQRLADQVSGIFVPIVLIFAITVLGAWLVLAPQFIGTAEAVRLGITCFISILAIACPCALGLATPTGIMVGLGLASRNGILIKNAEILEKLGKTKTIVFDKTGTITKGQAEVSSFKSFIPENDFLSLAASLESKSNHPLAYAIVKFATNQKVKLQESANFVDHSGFGISGKINNIVYYLGSFAFMEKMNISLPEAEVANLSQQGKTIVWLSEKNRLLGYLVISDNIKNEAALAINELQSLGIKTIMLSGDRYETAKSIANQVGITEVIAEVSPLEKADKIKALKKSGELVTMVGDGVNDAVALAAADIGLAMSTGSDVAIESADVTILQGDLDKIIKAIKISRLTIKKIKQNLFWAFFYNIVALPIAAGALYPIFSLLLSPIIAAGAMTLSSLSVILNTLAMKNTKI